jgi:8-oxo-dGTP pyrophosphatase MutT (NUDIX family)
VNAGGPVHEFQVVESKERFVGGIFSVHSDLVTMPGGTTAWRDRTHHLGAVAVVALDDEGRVVLVRQYRHPVGRVLWELPAGLADVEGESGLLTGQRELAEEADLVARQWDPLLELHTSPGYSDEHLRVFLARGLSPVPEAQLHRREHEEAEMSTAMVDLDEAVAMVLRGEITNATTVAGLLAAARVRDQAPAGLA